MLLAVIRVRAVGAPLNKDYTSEEFEFYLSDSESKLLLTPTDGNAAAQAAALKLSIPHATVALSSADSDVTISLNHPESESNSEVSLVNDPSDVALFLHTSGTTSRPKGVPLSQLNLVSSVRNNKSVYKLTASDSTVIVLPLLHVHGLIAALLSSLGSGASVTLPAAGRFSASTFWADMKKSNATWYTAVPKIHQIIFDRHLSMPEPEYPSLRFIRSCSAPLAPAVLNRLEEPFGAPVLEAYAMTEATHLMCTNPLPEDGSQCPIRQAQWAALWVRRWLFWIQMVWFKVPIVKGRFVFGVRMLQEGARITRRQTNQLFNSGGFIPKSSSSSLT